MTTLAKRRAYWFEYYLAQTGISKGALGRAGGPRGGHQNIQSVLNGSQPTDRRLEAYARRLGVDPHAFTAPIPN